MRLAKVLAFAMLASARVGAQERWRSLDDFLARGIGLSAAQLSSVARGEPVAAILRTADERDVTVFGVVQVNVLRSRFTEHPADFTRSLHREGRSPVRLFGDPASPSDMQALEVTAEDLTRLRACRPTACDFKLPATDMGRVSAIIDSSPSDARARVAAYARQRIVALVTDYRLRGNAALGAYDDRARVYAADAFAALLQDSSLAFRIAPSLARHLLDAPRDTLRGATEATYWSVDAMPNVRPTLRVMHEIVYSPPDAPGITILVAKQLFANHYFEAGLEVLTVVDRTAGASANAGVTVMAMRRYRFDNLPNAWPLNLRTRVVNGLRDQVLADLARLRHTTDSPPSPATARE